MLAKTLPNVTFNAIPRSCARNLAILGIGRMPRCAGCLRRRSRRPLRQHFSRVHKLFRGARAVTWQVTETSPGPALGAHPKRRGSARAASARPASGVGLEAARGPAGAAASTRPEGSGRLSRPRAACHAAFVVLLPIQLVRLDGRAVALPLGPVVLIERVARPPRDAASHAETH